MMNSQWTIRDVSPDDPDYQSLLDRHEHLIFHSSAWADVLRSGISPEILCWVLYCDDEPRAGLLGTKIQLGPFRFGHFAVPYGSLIGVPPSPAVVRRLLTEAARRHHLFRLRLTGWPGQNRFGIERAAGQPEFTHIMPLEFENEDELLSSYKSSVRRDVRRAVRKGVNISKVDCGGEAVDKFYDLYLETMQRQQATPKYRPEFCQAILNRLGSDSKAALLAATVDNQMIAALIVVSSQDSSHYLFGASDYNYRSYQPNELLLHHALLHAKSLNNRYFDFLPSGDSASGVSTFKTKFGAHETELENHTLVINSVWESAWKFAYRFVNSTFVRWFLRKYRKLR